MKKFIIAIGIIFIISSFAAAPECGRKACGDGDKVVCCTDPDKSIWYRDPGVSGAAY